MLMKVVASACEGVVGELVARGVAETTASLIARHGQEGRSPKLPVR